MHLKNFQHKASGYRLTQVFLSLTIPQCKVPQIHTFLDCFRCSLLTRIFSGAFGLVCSQLDMVALNSSWPNLTVLLPSISSVGGYTTLSQ